MLRFIGKKRRNDNDKNKAMQKFLECDCRFISLRDIIDEIRDATQNFSPQRKIGEGGFGEVYKGILPNGVTFAVKKLSRKSGQGILEFMTEGYLLSSVEHFNIVKLYGSYSWQKKHLLLYEYLENNSLGVALFGEQGSRLKLNWNIRHRICLGLARGLAYLHEEISPRIIHRDIKLTNILLDQNFNAKISDFGLAKHFQDDDTHVSTRIAGTIGYMAPEYALRGLLTEKADVYSFGVVLLEIVSGRRHSISIDSKSIFLVDMAYRLQQEKRLRDLIDENVIHDSDFSDKQAYTILNLAIWCISSSPDLRPKMSDVVRILEGKKEIEDFPLSNSWATPGVIVEKNSLVQNSSSSESSSFSTYVCKCCGEQLCTDFSKKIPAKNEVPRKLVSSYFRIKETRISNYPAKCVSLPYVARESPLPIESSPRTINKNEGGMLPLGCEENRGKSSVLVLAYEVPTETSVVVAAANRFEMELDGVAEQLPPIDSGKILTERLYLNELTNVENSLEMQARIPSLSEMDDSQLLSEQVREVMVDDLPSQVIEPSSVPVEVETNQLLQLSLIDAPESKSEMPSISSQNEVATSFDYSILQAKFAHICSSAEETQERVVFERPTRNLNRTVELVLPARHFVEGLRETLASIEPNNVSEMVNMARHIFSFLDMMKVDYNSLIDEVENFINACQAMKSSHRADKVSAFKEHVNHLLRVNRQTIEESIQSVPLLRERALKTEHKAAALRTRIDELENELAEARCQLKDLGEAAKLSSKELLEKMALLESLNEGETTLIALLQEAQEEERRINETRHAAEKNFILCRDQMKASSM